MRNDEGVSCISNNALLLNRNYLNQQSQFSQSSFQSQQSTFLDFNKLSKINKFQRSKFLQNIQNSQDQSFSCSQNSILKILKKDQFQKLPQNFDQNLSKIFQKSFSINQSDFKDQQELSQSLTRILSQSLNSSVISISVQQQESESKIRQSLSWIKVSNIKKSNQFSLVKQDPPTIKFFICEMQRGQKIKNEQMIQLQQCQQQRKKLQQIYQQLNNAKLHKQLREFLDQKHIQTEQKINSLKEAMYKIQSMYRG